MDNQKHKQNVLIGAALFVVALAGGAMLYLGAPITKVLDAQVPQPYGDGFADAASGVPLRDSTQDQLIHRYIAAYQTQNCAEVARCTLWVQDRVRVINAQSDDEAAREESRAELCRQLFSKESGQNQLSILGIDEQYLIPVTATFTIEGADDGRRDLDWPVMERVWGVFTYNDRRTAPRNEKGEPVRSMRAGVNVSTDSLILKGSVRGNWEIDFGSISVEW